MRRAVADCRYMHCTIGLMRILGLPPSTLYEYSLLPIRLHYDYDCTPYVSQLHAFSHIPTRI